MSGVMMPGQRQGLMSQVAQGLAIARDVYGLKVASDQQDQAAEDRKTKNEAMKRRQAGVLDASELQDAAIKGAKVSDKPFEGAAPYRSEAGGPIVGYVGKAKEPTIKPPNVKEVGGSLVQLDEKTGKWAPVYTAPAKAEKQELVSVETVDDKGNAVTKFVPKTAGAVYQKPKTSNKADEGFAKLSKPQQITVTKLTEDNARLTPIVTQIDNQLANLQKAWQSGDTDMAVQQGNEMLKILNSDIGSDAVGAEEARRLGSFLEYKIANFTGPGSFVGRDVDKFFEQAAQKNNSLKQRLTQNQQTVEDILAGKGSPQFQMTNTKIGEKGGAGTAQAATPPQVGEVHDGYRFKGGDPSKRENWEKQ